MLRLDLSFTNETAYYYYLLWAKTIRALHCTDTMPCNVRVGVLATGTGTSYCQEVLRRSAHITHTVPGQLHLVPGAASCRITAAQGIAQVQRCPLFSLEMLISMPPGPL